MCEYMMDEEREEEVVPFNFHNITVDDMKNGDGLRTVLWVAGCPHHCEGCHNKMTWDPNGGVPFTRYLEEEFWENLKKPHISGATFSGGDPLYEQNRPYIATMIRRIKEEFPDKTIWVYTGYDVTLEEDGELYFSSDILEQKFPYEAAKLVDVIVDGRFDYKRRKKDIEEGKQVLWRGSSNQRIIDVPASLKAGRIVERSSYGN